MDCEIYRHNFMIKHFSTAFTSLVSMAVLFPDSCTASPECETSGYVVEVFALLGCYAAQVGSCILTVYHVISVRS
jgi:hypothetical protein